ELPTANGRVMVQLMRPALSTAGVVQFQPLGVSTRLRKVVPAGVVSLMVVPTELEGPLLVAVIVYVTGVPGVTGSVEIDLTTARLAEGAPTVFDVDPVWLPVLPETSHETCAVLVIVEPCDAPGSTLTPRLNTALLPATREPLAIEHRARPNENVQLHVAPPDDVTPRA